MSTTETTTRAGGYALGYTREEYERLRVQARAWETATGLVLDQIRLPKGARCLDAGCGPGETMRLLAQRAGAGGRVLGIDADSSIGTLAAEMLHGGGFRHCDFQAHDLTADEPVPGAPFDLVYARLLLFHLPQRVEVLTRLWHAVAPGGHLVVQDYDVGVVRVIPDLPSVDEVGRVIKETFGAAGGRLAGRRPATAALRAGRRGSSRRHRRRRAHRAAARRPRHAGQRLPQPAPGRARAWHHHRGGRRRDPGRARPRRRSLP